ncbi:MAG TPA: SAM-dependent chlorinase/fluorinase [Blastocatellia bacterium]|nr:SAM-dependent chlorinase/fluorinase [Blastocatellia bacterium]
MVASLPIITLLTDFGTPDYFVPAMKGVIYSLHSRAQIIDLTHDIPAQDIDAAAFTLGACYRQFPAGTIHVAVVDPGVGSARRAIVMEAGGQYFVGPDNGLFSFVYAREKAVRVFQATNEAYFRQPVSSTFHGRDVFAPLAAWLAKGIAPESFGAAIQDAVRFPFPAPQPSGDVTRGAIIHIDHFGNGITNLTAQELTLSAVTPTTCLLVAGHEVRYFGTHFAQTQNQQEPMAYLGSAGYWEIAVWQGSAAQVLGLQRGAEVELRH